MPDVLPVPGASITTFGELLRYLRQRAGLTQQEFGLAIELAGWRERLALASDATLRCCSDSLR